MERRDFPNVPLFALFALGFSSVVCQMVFVRESLAIFGGNELLAGLALGAWLLLMGLGALLAGRFRAKKDIFPAGQLLLSVLPPLQLILLRAVRAGLFLPGELVDPVRFLLVCLAVLAPYCLLAGYLLSLASSAAGAAGRTYSADSAGSVAGGLVFAFVLAVFLGPLQSLAVAGIANALSAVLKGGRRLFIPAMFAGALLLLAASPASEALTLSPLFPSQRLLGYRYTPYGFLAASEKDGQISFFSDAQLLFSTGETEAAEETAHYAMAQLDAPPSEVLLIGGGMGGSVDELSKYGSAAVDYVELDPAIFSMGRSFNRSLANPIAADGRSFVRASAPARYDAIIVDLPDPETAQLNRFYTTAFFAEAKRALRPGGVLAISLSISGEYLGPEEQSLGSAVYGSLRKSFGNVLVLPGLRAHLLASDAALTSDIAGRLARAGIKTEYVNADYLSGTLTAERVSAINAALSSGGSENTDLFPVGYGTYLRKWLRQFGVSSALLFLAVLAPPLVLFLLLSGRRPPEVSVAAAGFSASSLVFLLLLGFQMVHGYAYGAIGVLMASFMLGCAAGAWLENRAKRKCLAAVQLSLAAFASLLPLALPFLPRAAFYLAALLLGSITGAGFSMASLVSGAAPSRLYFSDFLGGFAGALASSMLLVPSFGLPGAAAFVGCVGLLAALVVTLLGGR